ncbi:CRISPR-associated endoribonuclease Cas6 [Thermovenabulum sp.]|uniref:CRISPR-associated endoribonuclease Cas6 n=1 Tax=Thermovenabulum sp. TaxID=3100335 RepID=UPI003C7AB99E
MHRAKVIFKAKEGIYFDNSYKLYFKRFFERHCPEGFYVFSDVIPRKTKKTENGFWAIDKIAFYFSHYNPETLVNLTLKLFEEKITINDNQVLNIEKTEFIKPKNEYNAYLWSPLMVVDNNLKPVEYEREPERFNEFLRLNLINKYKKVYGNYPEDDRFVFVFKNNFEKIMEIDFVLYKGAFEVLGSEELLKIAYICGLGHFNENGYGMISDELYVWKHS